jgi:hypothetical protein
LAKHCYFPRNMASFLQVNCKLRAQWGL